MHFSPSFLPSFLLCYAQRCKYVSLFTWIWSRLYIVLWNVIWTTYTKKYLTITNIAHFIKYVQQNVQYVCRQCPQNFMSLIVHLCTRNKFKLYRSFLFRWPSTGIQNSSHPSIFLTCYSYTTRHKLAALSVTVWENQVIWPNPGTWRLSKSIHSWCGRCTWWLIVMCKFTPF